MERKQLFRVVLVIAVLLGFVCVSFAVPPAGSGSLNPKPVKIKLPKVLYCAMTAVKDRYSINLRPITLAIGEPAETSEVLLFRNDHLVTPLGKIGGGEELEEFILFTLPPADADAFNRTTATRDEMGGMSEQQPGIEWDIQGDGSESQARTGILRSKMGRNFELHILNAAGEILYKKKIVLMLQ
jgi:hypothetical protein